jgi:AcrR family transcriptional regulator
MPTRARKKARGRRTARAGKPGAPRGTRERLEVDERRAQLVRLGIDLFASRSYDDVSIDELAREAGISKGLLYHYFGTKRDFYVATVREASRQLVDLTATSDEMPPVERARAGLDAYLDYVEAHAPSYAALMRGGIGSDPEVAQIVDDTRDQLCDRMLSGLPGVEPTALVRVAVRGWIGFCEATSLEWIARRAVARSAIRDLMIETLLAAVAATGAIAARGAKVATP